MRTRIRLIVVLLLALAALGVRVTPLPALAAGLCPGGEQDIINAIGAAGNGGTVTLSCPSATTIYFDNANGHNGTGGPITISQSVTLDASGSPQPITFDGGGSTYLFDVFTGGTLTLNSLTLQHASYGGMGAILSTGTLNIANSTVTANEGALESSGTLTITNSSFTGNYGGAIDNAFQNSFTGHLTVTNSTFANNRNPGGEGGAIENENGGTLSVTNSTFSGNQAGYGGGAILNGNEASVTITDSTIVGNSVDSLSPWGSAMFIASGGTVAISGTIIAGNTGGSNCYTAAQVSDAITDGGYNLTDRNGNCGLTGSTDLTNANPLLDPQGLQNNGGPTMTVALQPGSPAIDTIPTSSGRCPATDQRGITRPDGENVRGETTCDMGAYEYIETFPCPATEGELAQNISAAPVGGGTVSLSCPSATTIYFDTANGHNGTGSPITISRSVTLDASSSPGPITLDGGHTAQGGGVQLFTVNSGATLTLNRLTMQNAAGSNSGGAIFNQGTVTIKNSTLSGNSATVGAAIFNSGTVTITDSTLSHNSTSDIGGALYTNNGGTVTITDSTLSGNIASTYGGAIFDYNATVTLTGSTLSGNAAYAGGAIFNEVGATSIGGSIIAGSTSGGNCYVSSPNATSTDRGYNLTDSNGNCGLTGSSDLTGTNPQLGPLQDNGGPTQTMALASTSPAIDKIPTSVTSLCPTSGTDQRGNARPDDTESVCDIGAYESSYAPISITITSPPPALTNSTSASVAFAGSGGSGSLTYTCQLDSGTPTGCTSPQTYSNLANGSHTFAVTAADQAGISRSASDQWTVDSAPPVISITSPAVNASYPLGQSRNSFTFSCNDPYDTITSCAGSLSGTGISGSTAVRSGDAIPTSAAGTFTVTVSATDQAGNNNQQQVSYTVANPTPATSSLTPVSATAGSNGFTLKVSGSNFVSTVSQVDWNGTALSGATYYSKGTQVTSTGSLADEIDVTVPASDLTSTGTASVTVITSGPGGGTSSPQEFFVTPATVSISAANSATSTNAGGTATATVGGSGAGTSGSLAATGSGQGTVAVAQYSSNPETSAPPATVNTYFDVYVPASSSFSQVQVTDCNLAGGSALFYWTGSAWAAVPNQSYSAGPPACVTATVSNTSILSGTPFAVVSNCSLAGYPKLANGAANLQNTKLAGCLLVGDNLASANAHNSNLSGVNLSYANLTGVNLTDTNLSNAILTGATLTGANLTGANLKGATGLKSATLTNVVWNKTTCPDNTTSSQDGGTCLGHL